MKKYLYCFLLFIFVLSTTAAFADDLADVRKDGKLTVALAPDYVPFVYYDQNGTLTGIDVELIKEVGKRMGVNVDIVDYAFDGMVDALRVEQVDVIGTAFAITAERKEVIDFTRAYYSGDSKFVIPSSSKLNKAISAADFAGMRVGVQKGTSFEQWIRTNLVDNDYIAAKNVYTYTLSSDAMKALEEGRVDTVLIDEESYMDIYEKSGKFKIFAEGFMKESYAFGVRKGSSLTAEINKHLNSMIDDGTAQKIANTFFAMDFTGITSNSERVDQLAIVKSTPTSAANCTNAMAFVNDVSIPDGTSFAPGKSFTKTWRVKNTGTCEWTTGYTIVFTAGDHMNGQTTSIPKNVQPGQTVDISVNMIAPNANGNYGGYWQLRSQYGYNFGQTLWLKIKVEGAKQTDGQKRVVPVIKNFYLSSTSGSPNECTTAYWTTENAASIDLLIDGRQFIRTQSASGNSTICDEIRDYANHSIELVAHSVTDDVRSTLYYETTGQYQVIPVVKSFFVNPDSGYEGDCTYAHWTVENAAGIDIYVDGNIYVQSHDATGYVPVCDEVQSAGTHSFTLVAHSVTDDASASATYTVLKNPEPEPYNPEPEPEPYNPEPEPYYPESDPEPYYPESESYSGGHSEAYEEEYSDPVVIEEYSDENL